MLLWLAAQPAVSAADPCRLESEAEVRRAHSLIAAHERIVRYCWFCEGAEPVPLRVRQLELRRSEPSHVEVVGWADDPPSRRRFPREALIQAERDGVGPLAAFLRRDVERQNAGNTGYAPGDPYLEQMKREQYAMYLRHARQDHDMRTGRELFVNGEPADPRLLYVPGGGERHRSLGHAVGCDMDRAPLTITYTPLDRDPGKEAPPTPFVADITGQCYDGACPREVWRAVRDVPLYGRPADDAQIVARIAAGEKLSPARTEAHVVGSRAVVTRDHDRFLENDVLYVLDSQAEGAYRVWHYGELRIIDATGIDLSRGWQSCREDSEGCWARGDSRPREIWWARVRHADGREGWVREPLESLDGVLRSD